MEINNILLILLFAAIGLTIYAQIKVRSTFRKYSKIRGSFGLTGSQVARYILDKNGLYNVRIEHVHGELSDHYDPRAKVVRLSDSVYGSTSLAAVAVAAHEVGHAIQDANDYSFLRFRHALVPLVNFTSRFTWILILAGLFFNMTGMLDLGIIFFSLAVLFQVITLPVEFNASKRALSELRTYELVAENEIVGSKKVLSAAALTYVAAMIYSVIELLHLIAMRNNN
ncbi:MAG: zinc metallopeptidase [Firmicutes bacterium]|nr:zinc metallopeptidase [Bacillota bacterium]